MANQVTPIYPAWVSTMGLPVWITDQDGTMRYMNARAEKFFGRAQSEWVGLPCHLCISGRASDGAVCSPRCRVRRQAEARREIEPVRMCLAAAPEQGEVSVVVIVVEGPAGRELVHCLVDDERERRLRSFLDRVIHRSEDAPGDKAPGGYDLTPREREIVSLLAADLSLHEIADRLSVSYTTVRTHVQHVLSKLGVHSMLEAVALWVMRDDARPHGPNRGSRPFRGSGS